MFLLSDEELDQCCYECHGTGLCCVCEGVGESEKLGIQCDSCFASGSCHICDGSGVMNGLD